MVEVCIELLAPGGGGSRSTMDAAVLWDWVDCDALGKVTKAEVGGTVEP